MVLYVDVPDFSLLQHLRTVKATASLVGKDIEIFFQQRNIANIFEPQQCSRQGVTQGKGLNVDETDKTI